jgi:hypothetical protein
VRGITELFETTVRTVPYVGFGAGRTYDVTGDGKRFLVNLAAAEERGALLDSLEVITSGARHSVDPGGLLRRHAPPQFLEPVQYDVDLCRLRFRQRGGVTIRKRRPSGVTSYATPVCGNPVAM